MRSVLEPARSLSRAREEAATCSDQWGTFQTTAFENEIPFNRYKLHSILYSCLHPSLEIHSKPLDANLGSFCYSVNLKGLRQIHFPLIGGKFHLLQAGWGH